MRPSPRRLTPPSRNTGNPDTGILVRLTKDPIGPPYLLVGPELAAETSNITRGEMNLRLVDQNFGGFGSEFRATARLGYMTDLSAEYYRLLTPGGFFIEPRAGIVREPVYIWANQKRVAERFQQNLDAGIEAGRTFGNPLQISAEWRAEDTRWSLAHRLRRRPLSRRNRANRPAPHQHRPGSLRHRLAPAASVSRPPPARSTTPSAAPTRRWSMLSFSRTCAVEQTNIFGISGDINSYLRANVAQPFRFTLGGPMRLSASSFDEYRGTDTYLARSRLHAPHRRPPHRPRPGPLRRHRL